MGCRSRLDRIYWNADAAGQLDRTHGCAALEWVPHLSAHRAVAFARLAASRTPDAITPLPDEVVDLDRWPTRVTVEHQVMREQATGEVSDLANLRILKQAMRTVTERMR